MSSSQSLAESGPGVRAAELLDHLLQGSADLQALALIGPDGTQITSTNGFDWSADAARLWTALDVLGEHAQQVHVATEAGEVFAVRDANGIALAATGRFALASLVLSDLRAALRLLAGGAA